MTTKPNETHNTVVRPDKEDKVPRHVAISIKHLQIQRAKAVSVRDKASKEVKEIDAALAALNQTVPQGE